MEAELAADAAHAVAAALDLGELKEDALAGAGAVDGAGPDLGARAGAQATCVAGRGGRTVRWTVRRMSRECALVGSARFGSPFPFELMRCCFSNMFQTCERDTCTSTPRTWLATRRARTGSAHITVDASPNLVLLICLWLSW